MAVQRWRLTGSLEGGPTPFFCSFATTCEFRTELDLKAARGFKTSQPYELVLFTGSASRLQVQDTRDLRSKLNERQGNDPTKQEDKLEGE